MGGTAPVAAGEAINIEARIWNKMLAQLGRATNALSAQITTEAEASKLVMATNNSATTIEAFGVGMIDGVSTTASGDLPAFQFEPTFSLTAPVAFGKIAIAADYIAVGEVGTIFVSGIVPVQVVINHVNHKYATLGTSHTALQSASAGECRILYQSGTTGTVWCLVMLNSTDVRLYDEFDGTSEYQQLVSLAGMVQWVDVDAEYGAGFWGKIQSEVAGVYAGDILKRDGVTDTGANFANAVEVSGRLGIPAGSTGSTVWIRPTDDQSGSLDFAFEYHGAASGTPDDLTRDDTTVLSPILDTWIRSNQGSLRGGIYTVITGVRADSTNNYLYSFAREVTIDANGHVTAISAEERTLVATIDDITDGTPVDDDITKGLLLWYEFETGSGNTAIDTGGGGHDGDMTGNTWETGYVGNYSAGIGSTGDVETDNSAALNTNALTAAAWVKVSTDQLGYVFFKQNTAGTVRWELNLGESSASLTNELISISHNDTDHTPSIRLGYETATRSELFDGAWHHVAVTGDGSTYKIYLDGVSKTITVGSGANDGASLLSDYDESSVGWKIGGDIDDFRLYNRALSASEISILAGQ